MPQAQKTHNSLNTSASMTEAVLEQDMLERTMRAVISSESNGKSHDIYDGLYLQIVKATSRPYAGWLGRPCCQSEEMLFSSGRGPLHRVTNDSQ